MTDAALLAEPRHAAPPGAGGTAHPAADLLPAAAQDGPGPRLLARLPLLWRVLFANALVVVFGAVVGTIVTIDASGSGAHPLGLPLAFVFAGIGVVLSVAASWFVLRAAFRPLLTLERVADAVRWGDLSARVPPIPHGDPQVVHLARVFNRTLDQLEQDRALLRSVASQVINAQEEERKRISRELHDDTAQLLFVQLLRVAALKESANPEVREAAERFEETTTDALESVRRLALELRPPALDDLGLEAALAGLAQRFGEQLGIPVEVTGHGPRGRLPAEVELVLYRVAQEALTNATKHAQATRIVVDLERREADVALSVRDDGRGFDAEARANGTSSGSGLGLFGMAERIDLVGGRLAIWSGPGEGTEVYAFLPIGDGRLPVAPR